MRVDEQPGQLQDLALTEEHAWGLEQAVWGLLQLPLIFPPLGQQ